VFGLPPYTNTNGNPLLQTLRNIVCVVLADVDTRQLKADNPGLVLTLVAAQPLGWRGLGFKVRPRTPSMVLPGVGSLTVVAHIGCILHSAAAS
jgi:hypothetical protein